MFRCAFIGTLLATAFLAQLVTSSVPAVSVIPLVADENLLSRKGRDLLLTDEDDDFDFFQQQPLDLKLDDYDMLMETNSRQRTAAGPMVDSSQVKALLMKLQLKSNQFMEISRETAHSAVSLLASCAKLVENSDDNFVIMAH